mgnify:CR=1 FL=1
MTKEEVDADFKSFLDILAIACEVLQVAGHQTLVEKLFDNIDELQAREKVLVEALGTAQDELTHLSHHTREDYARDCVNKIFNSIEQALANVRGE